MQNKSTSLMLISHVQLLARLNYQTFFLRTKSSHITILQYSFYANTYLKKKKKKAKHFINRFT